MLSQIYISREEDEIAACNESWRTSRTTTNREKRINGEIAVNIVIKTISFVLPEPGLNETLSAAKKNNKHAQVYVRKTSIVGSLA